MGQAIPAIIGMAAGGAGSLLGGLGAGSGTWANDPIGSASDVANVNPYTSSAWNTMMSQLGQYSPTRNIANLQGVMPGVQSIVGQLTGPYSSNYNQLANLIGSQTQRNVASQYAGSGALNSGAALSAMARGWAEPTAQAATNIANIQSTVGSGLLGNILGQMGQSYSLGLGGIGQLGQQEWWQPSYNSTYQPGPLELIGMFLSGMGGGGAGLGSLIGMGGSGSSGGSSGGNSASSGGAFV